MWITRGPRVSEGWYTVVYMGASKTLMCMQVTWGFEESADSDSAGLGVGVGWQDSASPSKDPGGKPVLVTCGLFRRVSEPFPATPGALAP